MNFVIPYSSIYLWDVKIYYDYKEKTLTHNVQIAQELGVLTCFRFQTQPRAENDLTLGMRSNSG